MKHGREYDHLFSIVQQCAYRGLSLECGLEEGRGYLRVVAEAGSPWAFDTKEPFTPMPWKGRKWRLSPHMTDGEVVQTAFKAILTAIEHEVREGFLFGGCAVFDPHLDIYGLQMVARAGPVTRHNPE